LKAGKSPAKSYLSPSRTIRTRLKERFQVGGKSGQLKAGCQMKVWDPAARREPVRATVTNPASGGSETGNPPRCNLRKTRYQEAFPRVKGQSIRQIFLKQNPAYEPSTVY